MGVPLPRVGGLCVEGVRDGHDTRLHLKLCMPQELANLGCKAATAMDVGWPQPQRAGQPGLRCRPTQPASAVHVPPRDPSADVFLYVYWGALRVGRRT